MCRTFLHPEKMSWSILFFFLTSCLYRKVEAIYGSSVDNWCSKKHCENCAKSEILQCSENALSIPCGDLCGCCQSCVQFRDLGQSCGSQLSVRSSANENFENAKSRVTIIATSSCKHGLVCIESVCQGKNEALDSFDIAEVQLHPRILNVENGFLEFRDFPTDVIKLRDQSQSGYQHYNYNGVKYRRADEREGSDDALARKITRPTFTAKPLFSLTEILLNLRSHKNEVSNFRKSATQVSKQTVLFGPPRRLLNLIIDDKEFQLIYGWDALADLEILLKSVDKSQPNSIVDEFEAQTIYERFEILLNDTNDKKDKSVTKKEITLYPRRVQEAKNSKNEDPKLSGIVLQSGGFSLLKKNEFSQISNIKRPELLVEKLRSKSEKGDAENFKVYLGIQYNNVNLKERVDKRENREFPVYDSVNKPSVAMENVNKEVTDNVPYSMVFPLQQNFLFARIPYTRRSGFQVGGFRKKRKTKDPEKSKAYVETQYKSKKPKAIDETLNTKHINRKTNNELFTDNDSAKKSSATIQEENEKSTEDVLYSSAFPSQRILPFSSIPNTKVPILRIGGFREKRESKVAEEQQNFHNISNPKANIYDKSNTKFLFTDNPNETPRTMEIVNQYWRVDMEGDTGEKLPIDEKTKFGPTETSMNIHIAGDPKPDSTADDLSFKGKSTKKDRERMEESVEKDYGHYDVGLEVFVTEANVEVSTMEAEEDLYNFENFSKVEGSKTYKKVERDKLDNVTENLASQTSQFTGNVYQFTFPKNPESDSLRELSIRVNETVEDFRARLDRIEMKVVEIASLIFNHFFYLRSNKKSRISEESENSSISTNTNPVGWRLASMNIQSLVNSTSERGNRFTEIPVMSPQTEWTSFPKEKSTGRSQHRHWRDFMVLPSLSEVSQDVRATRRRPNEIKSNGVVLPQRKSHRNIITRFPVDSEEKSPATIAELSNTTFVEDNQHTSKEFADEQFEYKMDSDPLLGRASISRQQILWHSNPAGNKEERNKRTTTPEISTIAKSIFSLETQIPKPVRPGLLRIFGHQLAGRSLELLGAKIPMTSSTMTHPMKDEFSGQFGEKSDDRNLESWVTEPSFNLFIVHDKNSESELGKSLEAGESLQDFVLPVENFQTPTTQKNREVDDNWDPIYPEYLDYAEEAQKDGVTKAIAEMGTTKLPKRHQRTQRIDLGYHDRKKRSVKLSLQEEDDEEFHNRKKIKLNDVLTDSNLNNESIQRSLFSTVSGNDNDESSKTAGPTTKLRRNRKRRNVQMADWLQAAQEYHDRLRQIRTAALKTWLASQDEFEHSNLTDVKLFTREIPAYLENYTPNSNVKDQSTEGSAEKKVYSVLTEFSGQSTTNNDELVEKMIADSSSQFEDISKKNEEHSPDQVLNMSSSSVPRKFTIFTTGDSTIKIEEMPKIIEKDFESSFEDRSEPDSTKREVLAHEVNFIPSESEIFDHMYESIDAEDEDFDYGDPEFTTSRLLDQVDIVDDSNRENLEGRFGATSKRGFERDENVEDDEEIDVLADLFSRTKRDSPFFLFQVKGNPAQDVVIWPSNWEHLIRRHLKFNRSRSSETQPQKGARRSYVKLAKVVPKHVVTLEPSAKSFSTLEPSSSKPSGWR